MTMHRSSLLIASLTVLAARLPAQTFEGTVSIKSDDPKALTDQKLYIQANRMAITGTVPAGSEMGGGSEMKILIDWPTRKMTLLIPLSAEMAGRMGAMGGMGSMKGMKMVMDIPTAKEGAKTGIKNLGTSETIAGYQCDDYEETGTKTPRQMCLTKHLGHFTYPSTGGRGGGAPNWVTAIGDNGFPLKVWTPGGKVDFEVTEVKPGSVSGGMWAIPDGYMDMPGMGGRGGGL
jgi:Domain of unknown function (DUF4412)